MLAAVLGLNLKLIPGYSGQEVQLAILRGEIQGVVGSFSSLSSFVDNGYGRILTRIGGDRVKGLDDIPEAGGLAAGARQAPGIIEVVRANAQLGRLTAAPPDTPDDRLQPLIAAYRSALEDPALLEDAAKLDRPIDPDYGEEVARQISSQRSVIAASRPVACGQGQSCLAAGLFGEGDRGAGIRTLCTFRGAGLERPGTCDGCKRLQTPTV